jgi:magnesium transporter
VGQTRLMNAVLTADGSTGPATHDQVAERLRSERFFWLDIDGVDDEVKSMLGDTFAIHPLAFINACEFHQRPKVEDYDDHTYMVAYGVAEADAGPTLVEVHFLFAPHYVVSIHHGPCAALDGVRDRLAQHHASEVQSPQIVLIYLMIDQLVDTFFPVLEKFDNVIDDLEDAILVRPTEAQLGKLFDMKRSLIAIRRVVTPQRDMFAGVSAGIIEIPGVTTEGERYMRDLYDHLIRISDLVDSYRDLLSGVMDTHLSTVSNRLNEVMKQLTIIATIFLPLSFLTGFFGQNFAVLVSGIESRAAFWGLGIGLEILAAVLLIYVFRRRGWLSQTD